MAEKIVFAKESDVPEILRFIKDLADYEKKINEVIATEELLKKNLFGPNKYAEAIFYEVDGRRVGFALFYHMFSTFLGRSGIYLEDLFVLPECRGKGYGKKLLAHLAKITKERDCAYLKWSVLKWNKPSIDFYHSLGCEDIDEWLTQKLDGEALDNLAAQ